VRSIFGLDNHVGPLGGPCLASIGLDGFRAIVAQLEPGPALAVTIAFETAWRIRSEVLTLEWARVDLGDGCICLGNL